jgi:hypothetical protein
VPDSGGFDLVSGFAFLVEVAAVDVVYDRNGKVPQRHILWREASASRYILVLVRNSPNPSYRLCIRSLNS